MQLVSLIFLSLSLAFGSVTTEVLPIKRLEKLKKGNCVFVHAWATWCPTCLQELPELLEALTKIKKVTPVVIDFSSPFVQDSISKKWLKNLPPSLKTYLKPKIDDEKYMAVVDPEWNGVLPYSALYARGVRKRVWLGSKATPTLKAAADVECQ